MCVCVCVCVCACVCMCVESRTKTSDLFVHVFVVDHLISGVVQLYLLYNLFASGKGHAVLVKSQNVMTLSCQ